MSTMLRVLAIFGLLLPVSGLAEVPGLLPVQGVLDDDQGRPLAGPVDLLFKIYDGEAAATELFGEELAGVALDQGRFAVSLGATRPLYLSELARATSLWLEVSVDGEALSRVQLQSVPYAVASYSCELLDGMAASEFAPMSHAHSDYAPTSHSHSQYSLTTHNHDRAYVGHGEDDSVDLSMMADRSVGTAELIDSSVTTSKLANQAVTSGKIAADAVTGVHVVDQSLTASKIEGAVYNLKSSVVVTEAQVAIVGGDYGGAEASCGDSNDLLLYGECAVPPSSALHLVRWRYLNTTTDAAASQISCTWRNTGSTSITTTARAYCLPVPGP